MKKYLLLTFFLFACITRMQAQCALYEVSLEDRVKSSSLIVEGKVKNSFSFRAKGHIYTSHEIEVFKIFKGEIPENKLLVLTQGGSLENEMETTTSLLTLEEGETGVLMLAPTDINIPGVFIKVFEATASKQGFIKYNFENAAANDFFNIYNNVNNDIYLPISKLSGTRVKTLKKFELKREQSLYNKREAGPKILSLYPLMISAGTSERLTITGSGFGNVKGSVGFKNSDGKDSIVKPFPLQYISWTDTKIVVEVPAFAGTGKIRVMNSTGSIDSSSAILKILFSRSNVERNGSVYKPQLIDEEGSGGYVLQMNEDFAQNLSAKHSFLNAILNWRCATLVNWTIGENTRVKDNQRDNINVVYIDKQHALPKGVLGICYSYYSSCSDARWFVGEYDVVFRDTSAWHFGSGPINKSNYDFETVALHELGHGHQLGHVIDTNDVMHYSLKRGRIRRILNNNNLNGANLVLASSTQNSACNYFPHRILTSAMCSNPEQAYFKFNGLDVYPNPFTDAAHVNYLLESDSNVLIDLFDITGKKVSRILNAHQLIGKHTIDIHASEYSLGKGVFIVRVTINDITYTARLVNLQ